MKFCKKSHNKLHAYIPHVHNTQKCILCGVVKDIKTKIIKTNKKEDRHLLHEINERLR